MNKETVLNRARSLKKKLILAFDKARIRAIAEPFSDDFSLVGDLYDEYANLVTEKGNVPHQVTANDHYFKMDLNPRQIVMVGLGKNVRGNMYYLLNELNSSEKFEGYEIFVRISPETEEAVRNFIRENHWERTTPVLKPSEFDRVIESAKYLITEVFFTEAWVKRPGQVSINLWHGTPIKKLGLSKNFKNSHRCGNTQKNFIDADYLTYPNEYTKENILASYRVSELMQGRVMMQGYPRTGGMLEAVGDKAKKVRERLAPNGEKLYLFMPTFRDYLTGEESVDLVKKLLDDLEAGFSEDQILYVNLHHKIDAEIDYSDYRKIRPFPPDIDTYQILAASDALITDYSSVMFDYLALRRQIILYIPDYETYRKKRGLYMDIRELPFDQAQEPAEVRAALDRGKQYDDNEAFHKFCAYDSPESAKKVCQLLLKDESALKLEDIPKNRLKKVLIHSELMEKDEGGRKLERFTKLYSREIYEIYFSCNRDELDRSKSMAYPTFFSFPVIGSDRNYHLSSVGKSVKELYLDKKMSFEEAIRYLRYDYALEPKRKFGNAHFDLVVIYDIDDPERLLSLAETGTTIIFFMQDKLLDQIEGGDTFMRDAFLYAVQYFTLIVTFTKDGSKRAKALLEKRYQKIVYQMKYTEQMDQIIVRVLEKN